METHEFKTEAKELLDLMIHSVYSNKEVFLRELLSNASDALDKLRFEALTTPALQGDAPLAITLSFDAAARTLTISDNGIGMNHDEVVSNIGTIARSGTREFLKNAKAAGAKADAPELIGQFGVGFYASFMVADRVTLVSRRAGTEEAVEWASAGDGSYTLQAAQRSEHGTSVTLHLKPVDEEDDREDFTDVNVLKKVVKRYSDFITYPVKIADDTINSMKPIWSRPTSEVTEAEYDDFYRHLTHDWQPAAVHIPLRAEGTFEYQALLYIPSQAPMDLFFREGKRGLTLYVKRVLILEECEELLPSYLRFVRGVVDSADLPLNVSREILQQNRQLAQIRKRLTKKVVDTLVTLSETEPDKYAALWEQFGQLIKEGYGTDGDNRDKLQGLLRFQTSHDKEKLSALADYVARMSAEQEFVYYIAGDSRVVVENSPHIEELREKGFEVLFLTDPVDELVTQHLLEVSGKKLRSAAKIEPRTTPPPEAGAFKSFFERLQKPLTEWVKEVRISERLRSSPACLVGEEGDLSPHLERLLQQAQKLSMKQKRILELNPKHPVVEKLKARFDLMPDAPGLDDDAYLLFGQAVLAEGSPLPDAARFSKLVGELMAR